MKQRWMLGCVLISATVLELCVASILRHKLNVIPNEDEGYREHIRKIRQVACSIPAGEVLEVTENCELDHGKRCSVKCKTGFTSDDPNVSEVELTCNDGKWEGTKPTCRKACISPADEHSQETANCEMHDGKRCSVKCKTGFTSDDPTVSEVELTCNDGIWEGTKPTCRSRNACSSPADQHLEVTENCEMDDGKKCSVKCSAEFTSEDPNVSYVELTCNDGTWVGTKPTCRSRIRCPVLQIFNATKYPACPESYSDQECTVNCQDNFDLDGAGKIKCDSTGNWSSEPKCNLTEGKLSRGTSGQRLTKITNNYNNYSCKDCIIVNS